MKQDALISLSFDYLHFFQTCHTFMPLRNCFYMQIKNENAIWIKTMQTSIFHYHWYLVNCQMIYFKID